jgi:hypothetical protein
MNTEEIFGMYPKILLNDLSFQKAKLQNLETKFIAAPGINKTLAREIMKCLMEISEIENEIDDLFKLATYPHHNVPVFDLLTNPVYATNN